MNAIVLQSIFFYANLMLNAVMLVWVLPHVGVSLADPGFVTACASAILFELLKVAGSMIYAVPKIVLRTRELIEKGSGEPYEPPKTERISYKKNLLLKLKDNLIFGAFAVYLFGNAWPKLLAFDSAFSFLTAAILLCGSYLILSVIIVPPNIYNKLLPPRDDNESS